VDWERLVLMSKIRVASGGLLLLARVVSNTLDLLELVFSKFRGLLMLVLDVTLELLSGGLADSSLLLRNRLDTSKMLTKLKLTFLSSLLALLFGGNLFVLGLFQLLLSFMVDGALALKGKSTALLCNTRRNRTNAVAQNVEALDLSTLKFFVYVTLSNRRWLRICLKTFLDLWDLSW